MMVTLKPSILNFHVRCPQEGRQNVKLYLHQETTSIQQPRGYGIQANGQDFYDLLNTWLTHYLYGVDNQVENLPAVLAQNNT